MSLRTSYRFIAPFYDVFLKRAQQTRGRVLKPGGRIFLLEKFLRHGERAWLRRALSPLAGQIATRLDVVFEDVLAAVPELHVLSDQPALGRGWFRLIELQKGKD